MEFTLLFFEYCIIPFLLWAVIFAIKILEHREEHKEKLHEYGYEFVFIEALSYLTFFMRVCFGDEHLRSTPVSWISGTICFVELTYFILSLLKNKSLHFRQTSEYRSIFYVFFWSLAIRIFCIALTTHLITFHGFEYIEIAISACILLAVYSIFYFLYQPIVEIFFITWPRAMNEKGKLIRIGFFRRAKYLSRRLEYLKYFSHDTNNLRGYCEAIKSYGDIALAESMRDKRELNTRYLKKASRKLRKLLYSGKFEGQYAKHLYTNMLFTLYIWLGDQTEKENLVNGFITENKEAYLDAKAEDLDNVIFSA